ncbi:MAG: OadG family protein [Candidatus Binatia bacterium]
MFTAQLKAGVEMALLGMGAVFVALSGLVLALTILRLAVDGPAKEEPGSESGGTGGLRRSRRKNGSVSSTDDLIEVALAAWAFHRSRSVRVRKAVQPSRWAVVGRSRQVARTWDGR